MRVNHQRIKQVKVAGEGHGPVIYWMSRDQRIDDNWALIYAQDLALAKECSLRIVFCLVADFLQAGLRQYDFMLKGLVKCSLQSSARNIPLDLIQGDPATTLPQYLGKIKASCLVMDFDPLKIKKKWQQKVLEKVNIPAFIVDAHNIVPCWAASDKQEYAARTIRSKIFRKLDEFLEPFPRLEKHAQETNDNVFSPEQILESLKLKSGPLPVQWLKSGPDEAIRELDNFIEKKLPVYAEYRNDPNKDTQSNLSPYLHFGQICSQTIALKIKNHPDGFLEARDSFLEELIIRKELSDNFCNYNHNYDKFEGLPGWGQKTLIKHQKDKRPFLYTLEQFEKGQTHDPLWNAAQLEMVAMGKMHGYMRMYWAKKILEWTENPWQAIEWAIYLNDKYELDGRDPNGYTGIMWSIGGLHDRPWKEREIFGMIRYMSYQGCKRKFDVDGYIKKWI